MPFSKTIEQPDGSDVRYWRCEQRNLHDGLKTVFVTFAGYRTKAAFNAGKPPGVRLMLGTNTEHPLDYEAVKGLNPPQMDDYILNHVPYFAGATPE